MNNFPAFSLMEIAPAPGGNREGITYIVADDGTVLFTREYTRHRNLQRRSHFASERIAWGGILTPTGQWVRRSFDFGDAPDPETRDWVIEMIQAVVMP